MFTQRDLNLRQRKWLDLLKDYGISVQYNANKGNVVGDALNRLSMSSMVHDDEAKKELVKNVYHLARLGMRLTYSNDGGIHVQNRVELPVVVNAKEKRIYTCCLLNGRSWLPK